MSENMDEIRLANYWLKVEDEYTEFIILTAMYFWDFHKKIFI